MPLPLMHDSNLNQADELVKQARLNAIEKEHRSRGSIVDNRELHKIVDPPSRVLQKLQKQESDRRLNSRKTNRGIDDETNPNDFDIQAFPLDDDDFENEEQMWKSKAATPAYIQKRRYENPELQKFRETMTTTQQSLFKVRTTEVLRNLARKLRAEMMELKRDLDRAGVFHSAANAHRVHCMYLMKLYKSIRADVIEDPVLRRIKAEELTKKREETLQEERKEKLLRLAEKNSGGLSQEDSAIFSKQVVLQPINPDELFQVEKKSKERKPLAEPKSRGDDGNQLVRSKSQSTAMKKSTSNLDAPLARRKGAASLRAIGVGTDGVGGPNMRLSQSAPLLGGAPPSPVSMSIANSPIRGAGPGPPSPGKLNIASSKDRGAALGQGAASGADLGSLASTQSDQSGDRGSQQLKGPAVNVNDRLMFAKMRRRRQGMADPRTLLLDDAARFDQAEVNEKRKTKERAGMFDDFIQEWMLNDLQHHVIAKTSEGHYLLSSTDVIPDEALNDHDLLASRHRSSISLDLGSAAKVGGAPKRKGAGTGLKNARDPQKIVPFEDFCALFDEYFNEDVAEEADPKDARASRVNSPTKHDSANGRPSDLFIDVDTYSHERVPGSPSQQRRQHDQLKPPGSPTARHTHTQHSVTSADGEDDGDVFWERANIVQMLAKKDNDFEAFMQSTVRQRPMSKIIEKASSKITKPRRVRQSSPLGRAAVSLGDGKVRIKDMAKGFKNHFKHVGMDDEEEEDSQSWQQVESIASGESFSIDGPDLPKGGASKGQILVETDADVVYHSHKLHGEAQSPDGRRSGPGTRRHSPSTSPGQGHGHGNRRKPQKHVRHEMPTNGQPVPLDDQLSMGEGGEGEVNMQAKLQVAWDCIRMPAQSRLAFMRKYSTEGYSIELPKATDMWSEAAVFVIARIETAFMMKKFRGGYCVFPYDIQDLVDRISSKLPSLLTSSSKNLVPPTLSHDLIAAKLRGGSVNDDDTQVRDFVEYHGPPLSYHATNNVLAAVREAFQAGGGVAMDAAAMEEGLTRAGQAVDALLSASLKRTREELEDVISFGEYPLKDWMQSEKPW